ncbi:MAG TPA: hypothetical protein VFP44_10680, partial [Usitatibacter sp.]|nr:hypothetical protein [Usitatibacter sp.]
YFVVRGHWYLGPRNSLGHLRAHAPDVYAAFERALEPGSSLADIERVVVHVAGPRDLAAAGRALFGPEAS